MVKHMSFHSVFAEDIDRLICEKRALGYKYEKAASLLKRFDDYVCVNATTESVLKKELVLGWTERTSWESRSTQQGRIAVMRGLAKYMNRLGKEAYIYPGRSDSVERYTYKPYIFSELEIAAIFEASDDYTISDRSPYRHLIIPLIIRMLYCCGLRVSEATGLTIADVDLNEGILHIRGTKFNKERLVPMSDNLVHRCRDYSRRLLLGGDCCDPFFPSPLGGHYDSNTVYKHFRKLLWKAGISHTGKGPRLHDLRHTFAVHCLKKWVIDGRDLTNCLPYLSRYLGHEDLRGTQHYLRLTADIYPSILQRVEESYSWMVPEVMTSEAH